MISPVLPIASKQDDAHTPAISGQYTPGPWSVSGTFEVRAARGTPVLIATASRSSSDWNAINAEAPHNARLIAAAPELYEAVQRAIRHAINIGISESGSSYFAQLTAAIAKATQP